MSGNINGEKVRGHILISLKTAFQHFIAGSHSPFVYSLNTLKTSLYIYHGVHLTCWLKGLCVMLERMAGIWPITNRRAILLMEANFIAMNKLIYSERMLDYAQKYGLMPEEKFSERYIEATDGSLAKVLFFNMVCQILQSDGLVSVDMAICYNQATHAISSLVFHAFRTHLVLTIQCVAQYKICSSSCALPLVTQMLKGCQSRVEDAWVQAGNSTTPARWAVVSVIILHAHKTRGYGASFFAQIQN